MPRSSSGFVPFVLALAVTSGCRTTTGAFVWVEQYSPPAAGSETSYVIRPGDMVDVRVFNQDQMSAKVRVRSDGKVSLPFLNDVDTAGYTPGVLAQQLQTRLKEFINAPIVTVSVEEGKPAPISVLGQVARPGQYALEAGLTLLQALALAGGPTEFAHKDGVFVLREHPAPVRIRFRYDALLRGEGKGARFALQGGDVVVME